MSEETLSNSNNSLFDSNFSEQELNNENSSQNPDSSIDSDPATSSPTNENPLTEEEIANATVTIRSLVSSKEAGVIIGKAGKNVADLREQTGVKAGVSKSMGGVQERVLTVTGTLDGISRAYAIAASTLLESPVSAPQNNLFNNQPSTTTNSGTAVIRLLISHHQMGTIIGRQGLKIKTIQENSKVRMAASKQFLPNSTERIVEVHGKPEAIQSAIWEIGRCLLEETDRNSSTIFFNPQPGSSNIFNGNTSQTGRFNNGTNFSNNTHSNGNNLRFNPHHHNNHRGNGSINSRAPNASNEPVIQEQMAISADMVGCIIGRGGAKIAEIRRESGAKISIAKEPHDASGDRMFTISGTKKANEKAFKLLFNQLEAEKNRRAAELPDQQQQQDL